MTIPVLVPWAPLLALLLSAAVTEAAIRYAIYRDIIDHPGHRRSHEHPTPRGGGLGLVVAVFVFGLIALAAYLPPSLLVAWGAGLVLVAFIGSWDDHRPLGALPRLAVQLPVGLLLGWALVPWLPAVDGVAAGIGVGVIGVVALGTVWSINFHNFMDGINGLLGLQAAWLFAMVGLLSWLGLAHPLGVAPWVMAAATMAFVPFNFPRARVFMGDIGSGAIGFLVAATFFTAATSDLRWLLEGLILCSAFLIDASCTLIHRFRRGRRWYSAHREHLYQWLVRKNRSHARVVSYYMAWNLLVVSPVAVLAARADRLTALVAAAAVYVVGVGVWVHARSRLLAEVRRG
ncbi:MraY family glycosyltransferase [Tahibacter amnicola]|uniref:Glycosyltransferase family 4 protein n=1 Tax=Tahibacter amnicola TaxID=2976241 RepID=A0ABY6BAD4_9GAMM|nr:glycosyltransferase family 4 protein [Tahibacter amnicola]UXI66624.1 glycosyltransferase family 4 protein [Tahibacter amnicola]